MKTTLFIAASFLATAAVAQPIPKDADSGPIQAASIVEVGLIHILRCRGY